MNAFMAVINQVIVAVLGYLVDEVSHPTPQAVCDS